MPISYPPGTPWPPPAVVAAQERYTEWLTWYRGDPAELQAYYGRLAGVPTPRIRQSQFAGGISGAVARAWWGRPQIGAGQAKVHVPAAADVAALSAGLLFSDPPTLALPESAASSQETLDDILTKGGGYVAMHEAAEWGSAAGGVFVRASANRDVADGPILEAILPDCAAPEFYGPYLLAVTFWTKLSGRDERPVIRHLERHEMINGVCWVTHGLFAGAADKLGRPIPLTERPETERLAPLVDDTGSILIGTSKLDVVYVPTIKPNPYLPGTQLGRSDFAGAVQQLDNLDEVWTSLMRDFRLGKGRVFAPRQYIRTLGPEGSGGFFDPEQEIFQAVNAQLGSEGDKLALTASQFAIRVDEHLRGANELWRMILRRAGLDGNENDSEAAPETATSVNDKAARKRGTRALKAGYWTPALRQIGLVLLELYRLHWDRNVVAAMPDIEWPDAAAPDIETMARTLQLLDAAGAISTRTKVTMLHPEWSSDQIDEEVDAIAADKPPAPDFGDPGDLGANVNPQDNTQPVDSGGVNPDGG